MKLCLILVCAALLPAEAKVLHRGIGLVMCSKTDQELFYGIDGEQVYHIDFTAHKGVKTLPDFGDDYIFPKDYELSLARMEVCKVNLEYWTKNDNDSIDSLDAPQSSIYSKDDVELGSKNSLVCYITGFYPPQLRVTWTKNNINVTAEAKFTVYYPNPIDGTFDQISILSFTPEEGDIYSCRVEHAALDRPLTRIFDVQVALDPVSFHSDAVFCGVGLVGGLLGVSAGIYFFIKGNKFN
ncbi:H-2 class II histocompatibility antigen, A-Q alpha chain-like [Hoplias malabaricus]|uniref:H-2 class II histocompatibility antigen, A-Q alpha chain-like n=1 Tax=Hoplias malabaricus TaxID=27720 RepID=UPI003461D416